MMYPIEAIIVDDHQKNIDIIKYFIEKYCAKWVTVVDEATEIKDAIQIIDTIQPQLLFLDIRLGEATSFDILDKIKPYFFKVVFVTSYDCYALKAIKYNALDYILKPVEINELKRTVKKAYNDVTGNFFTKKMQLTSTAALFFNPEQSKDHIVITSINSIDIIKKKNIIYCKSEGGYTTFNLIDGEEFISSKSIGEYENLLVEGFYRVHHRYIINIEHIIKIHKNEGVYCEMVNRIVVPISVRKKDGLLRLFGVKK